jgi:hypothetical protein
LESIKRFVEPGWKVIYMAVVTATKRNDLVFLSVLDFLGYRSSFTNYGKTRKQFEKRLVSFWFYFDLYFFYAFKNILHTYTLPITMPIMFLMVYYGKILHEKYSFALP